MMLILILTKLVLMMLILVLTELVLFLMMLILVLTELVLMMLILVLSELVLFLMMLILVLSELLRPRSRSSREDQGRRRQLRQVQMAFTLLPLLRSLQGEWLSDLVKA